MKTQKHRPPRSQHRITQNPHHSSYHQTTTSSQLPPSPFTVGASTVQPPRHPSPPMTVALRHQAVAGAALAVSHFPNPSQLLFCVSKYYTAKIPFLVFLIRILVFFGAKSWADKLGLFFPFFFVLFGLGFFISYKSIFL